MDFKTFVVGHPSEVETQVKTCQAACNHGARGLGPGAS